MRVQVCASRRRAALGAPAPPGEQRAMLYATLRALQVINGSAYVAGESPLYESRGLSLKRQLLALWLAGDMPEGIDVGAAAACAPLAAQPAAACSVESGLRSRNRPLLAHPRPLPAHLPTPLAQFVLEQEDLPTVRAPSADCPARGPLLAPAKQPANASHRHVLLAPDHSFAGGRTGALGAGRLQGPSIMHGRAHAAQCGALPRPAFHPPAGWFEARTLPWDEMLPLLQRAGEHGPRRGAGCCLCPLASPGLRPAPAPVPHRAPCLPCTWPSTAARRHAWELRDGRLFFRGAATGERNVTDVKALAAQYPTSLVDVQVRPGLPPPPPCSWDPALAAPQHRRGSATPAYPAAPPRVPPSPPLPPASSSTGPARRTRGGLCRWPTTADISCCCTCQATPMQVRRQAHARRQARTHVRPACAAVHAPHRCPPRPPPQPPARLPPNKTRAAGRLKYLLACGSAVVVPENGWHEFWYHIIKPSTHLVVVEEGAWLPRGLGAALQVFPYAAATARWRDAWHPATPPPPVRALGPYHAVSMDNRGHHLAGVAAELQGDDWAARRLGAAGAELVAASLAPPMVQAYWRRLLSEYRRLQRYAASLHPDAVPLERAILVPEVGGACERAPRCRRAAVGHSRSRVAVRPPTHRTTRPPIAAPAAAQRHAAHVPRVCSHKGPAAGAAEGRPGPAAGAAAARGGGGAHDGLAARQRRRGSAGRGGGAAAAAAAARAAAARGGRWGAGVTASADCLLLTVCCWPACEHQFQICAGR